MSLWKAVLGRRKSPGSETGAGAKPVHGKALSAIEENHGAIFDNPSRFRGIPSKKRAAGDTRPVARI
jgi:hypothetical protein